MRSPVVGLPGNDLRRWLAELGTVPERLEAEGELSRGGMGVVQAVVDPALGRRVARKRLLERDSERMHLFLREARIVAQLEHPYIAPIYDLGLTVEGMPCFTMKLVEGRTLEELVAASPPGVLEREALVEVLEVVRKICDALSFAHSRGVLHCDVKPANVLVGDHGQAYLVDWGVARLIDTNDEADDEPLIMGTPAFMAPEQACGRRAALDVRTDVFGVGALLYYLLARRSPYGGDRLVDSVLRAQRTLFALPCDIFAEVPRELERIALKAMARDPDDRYWSMGELRDDLVRFLRGGEEFPRLTFIAGATIVAEGDAGHEAYIIVSGRCEVRQSDGAGSKVLRSMGRGETFGETALLTAEPRSASVVAVEDTVVGLVTEESLAREMDAMKPWMAAFVRTLATRFREADARHREAP